MTRNTVGRAAFIIAAGILLFVSTPTQAAGDGDVAADKSTRAGKPLALTKAKTTAKAAHSSKASRARKAAKVAALGLSQRKAIAAKQARTGSALETEMPDAVANAKAEMPAIEAHGDAATTGALSLEAAANDQLTELGRSLATPTAQDEPAPVATQLAANDQPPTAVPIVTPEPARAPTQASVAASTDAWAQSSLIGKIFIAFGGMLTLASAARMLIA